MTALRSGIKNEIVDGIFIGNFGSNNALGVKNVIWLFRNPTRNKKITELLRQEGVSPPPCPTPIKIHWGRVQLKGT